MRIAVQAQANLQGGVNHGAEEKDFSKDSLEGSMSLYRRGKIWWFKFNLNGATVYESSGLANKEAARAVEDKRHTQLRESRVSYTRRKCSAIHNGC
jgi:hypothetical protein